jgi:8-oxo-dGTP pyrophosphatase MutT (NUDIX family)
VNRLSRLATALAKRSPREVVDPTRGEAAVGLFLVPDPDRLLLIRRAVRRGDPWSGQLALPGGRREPNDADLLDTAVRETEEEVGFRVSARAPAVQLDDLAPTTPALPPVIVRPWVFLLDEEPLLRLNDEVAAITWVPLDLLLRPDLYRDADLLVRGRPMTVAGYHLEEGLLWGMTERIVTPVLRLWAGIGGDRSP